MERRLFPPGHVEADGAILRQWPDGGAAVDVADWLRALGLEQYEAAFHENDVDSELLPTLSADELRDMGVSSLRHRRRLLEAIAVLRSETLGAAAPPNLNGQPDPSETTAE